jgi:hypothetical protein
MFMCSVCGCSIIVGPDGCLLTHGPESIKGPYELCSGSGTRVETPVEDLETAT